MSEQAYEFNEVQNVTLAALSRWMTHASRCLYAFGALQVLGLAQAVPDQLDLVRLVPEFRLFVLINLALGITIVIANFAVAIWTANGAAAFMKVVNTQGDDVAHLMTALGQLRKTYRLIFSMLMASLVLMIIWWTCSAYLIKLSLSWMTI